MGCEKFFWGDGRVLSIVVVDTLINFSALIGIFPFKIVHFNLRKLHLIIVD